MINSQKINEQNSINSEVQRFSEQLYKIIEKIKKANLSELTILNGNVSINNVNSKHEFYLILPNNEKVIFNNIKIIITLDKESITTNNNKNSFELKIIKENGITTVYHEITHLYEILTKSSKGKTQRTPQTQTLYKLTTEYINYSQDFKTFMVNLYYFDKMESNAKIHELYRELGGLYSLNSQKEFLDKVNSLTFTKIIKNINSDNYADIIKNDIYKIKGKFGDVMIKNLCILFNCSEDYLPNKIDKHLKSKANTFLRKLFKLNDLLIKKIEPKDKTVSNNSQITQKQNIFIKIKNFLTNLIPK